MQTGNSQPLPRTSLEPVCPALARVIRERRLAKGWSLGKLAKLTALSRQMISFVETNRRVPTIDTVKRIGRALGIPLSHLLAEAEQRAE